MSKASKKLRRESAGAKRSRATELSLLAIGASLLAPLAIAQDAGSTSTAKPKTDDELTEILVTGIRKALQTSQEIKKDADTVVDSITASDIGAFPDKSVAEALQRVTGITVTRFSGASDTTHFSAEPSGVVIRGLPQVRSEFNGRDSFNANSSRGLSFGDVSPELMAGVDTYKNATADMIEGGIAGTVNLRTHVPFDSEGLVLAISGDMGYGDLSEEAKPSGSFIISNRWDTGIGEFGLMGNAAFSSVRARSQGVQIGRFFNNLNVTDFGGGTKWVPDGIDIRDQNYNRKRTGLAFAAQWKSPEDKLLATLQFNRSKYDNKWNEHSLTSDLGASAQSAQDLVNTSQTAYFANGTAPFEFDSNGVFMRGVLADTTAAWNSPGQNAQTAHPNGYDYGQGYLNWACNSPYIGTGTPGPCVESTTRGSGLGADTRYSSQINTTKDTSLNVRWDVNDRIGLNFDVQYIDAEVHNFDNSMNDKTFADTHLDLSGGRPKFSFTPAAGWGFTPGGFADAQNWFHEWVMEHFEDSSGTEVAGRIDMDIKLGDGWFDSLRIGVREAEREQDINWSTYNWGAIGPVWGIPAGQNFFLNETPWNTTYEAHDWGSSFLGGGVFEGGTYLHPAMFIAKDYQTTIDTFAGRARSWIPLAQRSSTPPAPGGALATDIVKCDVVPGTLYCPVEQQNVTEDTRAAYVMLKFGNDETKIGNVSVRGNVGVRFVKTEVNALGGVAFPTFTRPNPPAPGQNVPVTFLTSDDDARFMNGANFSQSGGGDHSNVLPSLNLRFGLTDSQFIRFAASRAMARPDMGLYKNYVGVSMEQPSCTNGSVTYSTPGDCNSLPIAFNPTYTASAGNPSLGSTTADQLDLTYEWYFSSTGSLTGAVFYKKFNDYIQYGNFLRDFTNNGVTRSVAINGPITGDGAKLKGFEIAYQSFLDFLPGAWSGFGYQVNFTYVDNQGITNSNLKSDGGGDGTTQQDTRITFTDLPLEGYSKTSYNAIAMYEHGKFSARLAYNWREKYLISQSDCCIKLPIWQDSYGQLDGSFHFKPSEAFDVFIDGQNLLQSETVLRQQVTNDGMTLPRSWFLNDRRFQLGVRYRFQ